MIRHYSPGATRRVSPRCSGPFTQARHLCATFSSLSDPRPACHSTSSESAAAGDAASLRQSLAEDPEAIRSFSGDGWTALHLAAAFGTPEAVRLLLETGAAVDTVSHNPQANQPLHAALALSRNPESIRLLLAAGANPNARQTGGFTPLFSAAAANRRDLAELLISSGADPAIRTDFGQSAADFARGAQPHRTSRLARKLIPSLKHQKVLPS